MDFEKNEKRPPLKDSELPLRDPGQGLRDAVAEEFELRFYVTGVTAALVIFAAYEWVAWYFNLKRDPTAATVLAVLALAYLLYRIYRRRKEMADIRLGLTGEKAVGQMLESLRGRGCVVFHDIPPDEDGGSNIDHVVVAPQGVFVVETKMRSKPPKGATELWLDGDGVRFSTGNYETDPVRQALALRKWLGTFLRRELGQEVPVKAAIIFPGWYAKWKRNRNAPADLWLLSGHQNGFSTYLDYEPERLTEDQRKRIVAKIEAYVHNKG